MIPGLLLAVLCVVSLVWASEGAHKSHSHHLINVERPTNLSCYTCSTFDDPNCRTINETHPEGSLPPRRNCSSDESYCSVTRVEYITGDAKKRTFWALERSCSTSCIDGCIVLGERTKLHLCSSCCESNFCNVNNWARATTMSSSFPAKLALVALMAFSGTRAASHLFQ